MKFGIHNSSWLDRPDPAEAFEAVKAKAQWAENHGFVWFSVLDHMIQIPRIGAPDEPFLEGWTVLSALAAVTTRYSSRHPFARRSVIEIPRIWPRSRRASI
jgi:alkanesulfonate monooxygenase SsuD/methylene tetrahydromethanopterin reductase-like flavin-dependent oxidoreductase (luciferase family)